VKAPCFSSHAPVVRRGFLSQSGGNLPAWDGKEGRLRVQRTGPAGRLRPSSCAVGKSFRTCTHDRQNFHPEALSLSGIPATGCVRCCQQFGISLLLFGATSQLYVMLAEQTAGMILLYSSSTCNTCRCLRREPSRGQLTPCAAETLLSRGHGLGRAHRLPGFQLFRISPAPGPGSRSGWGLKR